MFVMSDGLRFLEVEGRVVVKDVQGLFEHLRDIRCQWCVSSQHGRHGTAEYFKLSR